jgi:hypothetical protein
MVLRGNAMKKNNKSLEDAAELHRRAEVRLKEKRRNQGAGEEVQRSAEETQRLVNVVADACLRLFREKGFQF